MKDFVGLARFLFLHDATAVQKREKFRAVIQKMRRRVHELEREPMDQQYLIDGLDFSDVTVYAKDHLIAGIMFARSGAILKRNRRHIVLDHRMSSLIVHVERHCWINFLLHLERLVLTPFHYVINHVLRGWPVSMSVNKSVIRANALLVCRKSMFPVAVAVERLRSFAINAWKKYRCVRGSVMQISIVDDTNVENAAAPGNERHRSGWQRGRSFDLCKAST